MARLEVRATEPRAAQIIEDLQTDLKAYMNEAVRDGYETERIRRACYKLIKRAREALPSDELRARLDESAPGYLKKLYDEFRELYRLSREMVRVYAKDRREKDKPVRVDKKTGLLPDGINVPDVELYNMEPAARDYFVDYHRRVKERLQTILADELRPEYEGNVNLRTIAEMQIRYDKQKTMIKELEEKGEDLVWIDAHANCSKRCQPWQGKLYSLSGRSGKIDGISYRPLSDATDIPYTTKRGRTYMNGCVTGFGCRHGLTPYRKGSKPQEISAETVAKKREAEGKQRYFERKIRYQREKAIVMASIDPKGAREARLAAKNLTARYDAFSRKAGLPIIRERTRVVAGEDIYARNARK